MNSTQRQPLKRIGRKIGRMRELLGMKQQTLAEALGVSQQAVSKMEQSEWISDEKLEQVAAVLGVTAEAIEHFSEDVLAQTLRALPKPPPPPPKESPYLRIAAFQKLVSVYERLLQSEREKVAMLEEMLRLGHRKSKSSSKTSKD